ncbi:glycosyltransferase [Agarivorans litoreus]|uniref:glycosyltransferase n=1 Tax=Agarivorans litoreus TaxID=1510455 RepID=UPI001C7DD42D|nr:glycosyltransferase [Agarivorans litoreus]
MKVLHLCSSDLEGGAARAAYRLHLAQREAGLDSQMLVVDKKSDDPFVHCPKGFAKLRIKLAAAVALQLSKLQKTTNPIHHSLNIFPSGLLKVIDQISPDVVNLHWLGGEMLSIKEIGQIKQKTVWTMHDMWAFCGSEHYEDRENEKRYLRRYSKSNRNPMHSGFDLDAFIFKQKLKHWKNKKFHVVCPSSWLAECSKQSFLFKDQPTQVISNCIDQEVYKPVDKQVARDLLGLPRNKQLILFGAMSSTSDPRKGYTYLKEAMQLLKKKHKVDDVELVVFGASRGDTENETGIATHYMGRLYDDVSLVLLYNAADLFVAPSLQDNLPNTLVEALACGTPCVAFDIGGMKDLISNSTHGELVKDITSEALSCCLKNQLDKPADNIVDLISSPDKCIEKYRGNYSV